MVWLTPVQIYYHRQNLNEVVVHFLLTPLAVFSNYFLNCSFIPREQNCAHLLLFLLYTGWTKRMERSCLIFSKHFLFFSDWDNLIFTVPWIKICSLQLTWFYWYNLLFHRYNEISYVNVYLFSLILRIPVHQYYDFKVHVEIFIR